MSRSVWHKLEGREVRDEGGGEARAGSSVGDVQIGNQYRRADAQVECGKRHRAAAGAGVRLASAGVLDSSVSGLGPKIASRKAHKDSGVLDLSDGEEWAKGPIPANLVEAELGVRFVRPFGPTFNKAQLGFLGSLSSSRVPTESTGGVVEMEMELLAIEVVVDGGSRPACLKLTDEALLEEASRYPDVPRLWGSSSTPFLGSDVALVVSDGVSSGAEGSVEGALGRIPLQVRRIEDVSEIGGWNEPPWGSMERVSVNELALVSVGSDFSSPLVERIDCHLEEGGRDEGWSSSSLAKFSRCLGMPTEGFEEEILYLLRRMKRRIDKKG